MIVEEGRYFFYGENDDDNILLLLVWFISYVFMFNVCFFFLRKIYES